jgi:hypothetical protein
MPKACRGRMYEAVTVNGSVMTFQRRVGASTAVMVIDYGTSAATVSVTGLTANGVLATAYPGATADVAVDGSASQRDGGRASCAGSNLEVADKLLPCCL